MLVRVSLLLIFITLHSVWGQSVAVTDSNLAPSQGKLSKGDQEVLKALELHVAQTLETLHPSSAGIVVSRRGQVIFEKYLPGGGSPESPQAINKHSLWPLASCTKGFSAGLLFTLVHDGLFQLDDPVSKFLPAFTTRGNGSYDCRNVTFRHLASMTSGAQFDLAEGEEASRT